MSKNKKIIFMLAGLLILLLAPMYYLWRKESTEEQLLREKGIHAEAQVLSIRWTKVSKKSSRNYYMDIALFKTDQTKAPEKEEPSDSGHPVDAILAKMKIDTEPLGDYTTMSIPISSIEAEKYKKNDKVKVVYLKEKPEIIRLEEDL